MNSGSTSSLRRSACAAQNTATTANPPSAAPSQPRICTGTNERVIHGLRGGAARSVHRTKRMMHQCGHGQCVRETVTSQVSRLPFAELRKIVFHGVQVVEVGVQLRVHQDRGLEEDGESQVGVEREEGEIKENHTCMKMGWNEDSRTT